VTSLNAQHLLSRRRVADGSGVDLSALGPILFITILGIVVRAIPVLAASFPLNDGGLFVRMAETITTSGFSFPATVEYNGAVIPFAYPPLGLYLTATLHQSFGLGFIELAHFLPLVFAAATVPVMALICLELMESRVAAFAAGSAYALVPRAWEWLVGGGGLTRSPGVVFALLAILAAVRATRVRSVPGYLLTGALLALAGLAHPQAAMFGLVSVLFLIAWRSDVFLPQIALTVSAAVIVLAPWILVVAQNVGLAPFAAALRTGESPLTALVNLIGLRFTGAPFADVFVVLFGMGVLTAVARREFMLPGWAVLLFLIDARAAGQYAMVPVSMLIGSATGQLLALRPTIPTALDRQPGTDARRPLLVGLLTLGLLGSLSAPLRTGTPLEPLSPGDRDAMNWVSTQPGVKYAVISGENWAWDQTSEWFPQLTGAISIATVQGSEWASSDWVKTVRRHRELQECAGHGIDCLEQWMTEFGLPDYVYVSGRRQAVLAGGGACCTAIVIAMEHDPRFTQVYSRKGVGIFRVSPEALSMTPTRQFSIRTITPVVRRCFCARLRGEATDAFGYQRG
jgi:hypothetical protein